MLAHWVKVPTAQQGTGCLSLIPRTYGRVKERTSPTKQSFELGMCAMARVPSPTHTSCSHGHNDFYIDTFN